MSEQQETQGRLDAKIVAQKEAFAKGLQAGWDSVMEDFFCKVDAALEKTDLNSAQAEDALGRRYGWEVAEGWRDWAEDNE